MNVKKIVKTKQKGIMKELYKALAAFQQEVPIIHKDSKGFNYSYADLAAIFETINPLLKKHGLGFIQPIMNDKIRTIIFHTESGESFESETGFLSESIEYVKYAKEDKKGNISTAYKIIGFEGMNKAQAIGSLITYFRRYALASILGLVTDVDADARNKRIEEANKPLPALMPNTENWKKAIVALQAGYTIEQIKTKYSLTEENQEILLSESI